jgi:hypothetical protein
MEEQEWHLLENPSELLSCVSETTILAPEASSTRTFDDLFLQSLGGWTVDQKDAQHQQDMMVVLGLWEQSPSLASYDRYQEPNIGDLQRENARLLQDNARLRNTVSYLMCNTRSHELGSDIPHGEFGLDTADDEETYDDEVMSRGYSFPHIESQGCTPISDTTTQLAIGGHSEPYQCQHCFKSFPTNRDRKLVQPMSF